MKTISYEAELGNLIIYDRFYKIYSCIAKAINWKTVIVGIDNLVRNNYGAEILLDIDQYVSNQVTYRHLVIGQLREILKTQYKLKEKQGYLVIPSKDLVDSNGENVEMPNLPFDIMARTFLNFVNLHKRFPCEYSTKWECILRRWYFDIDHGRTSICIDEQVVFQKLQEMVHGYNFYDDFKECDAQEKRLKNRPDYCKEFRELKRESRVKELPRCKAALLLAIMDLIEKRKIKTNSIPLDITLSMKYSTYGLYMTNVCSKVYYYMKDEPFWKIKLKNNGTKPSFSSLDDVKRFMEDNAIIEQPLFDMMQDAKEREVLRKVLKDTYKIRKS